MLAGIIERDVHFGVGVLVTITRVVASEDLYYAHIFVSVLGGEDNQEAAALAELTRNVGMIQHQLNRKLRMRPVPRITFAIDQEEKRRERIEELLARGNPPPEN